MILRVKVKKYNEKKEKMEMKYRRIWMREIRREEEQEENNKKRNKKE